MCREERASTSGRRPRSVLRERARAQGWRSLCCLRQATGDSIPSVYWLHLLLDACGQGRRNERRRRFCARAPVQPSAARERQRVPNSSSQTDAMADQPLYWLLGTSVQKNSHCKNDRAYPHCLRMQGRQGTIERCYHVLTRQHNGLLGPPEKFTTLSPQKAQKCEISTSALAFRQPR